MKSILHDHFYFCQDKELSMAWIELQYEINEKNDYIKFIEKERDLYKSNFIKLLIPVSFLLITSILFLIFN